MCWQALDTFDKKDRISTPQMNKEDRYINSLASIQIAPGTCLTSRTDASAIWYTSCLFSVRSVSDLERYLPRITLFPDNAQSSGILLRLSFHTTWRTLWTGCHSLATLTKKENKLSLELNGLKVVILQSYHVSQVSCLSQNTPDNQL